MEYLIYLLFSPTGRIRRRDFWIGLVTIIVTASICYMLVQPSYVLDDTAPGLGIKTIDLLCWFPSLAITVKRLNDRDWPRWITYMVIIAWFPVYIGPFFGLFLDTANPTTFEIAGWFIFIVVMLPVLIDNGFLKGTSGTNRYGEDPRQTGNPSDA